MKILKVLGLVLLLGGCIHAGPISFFESRSDFLANATSYPIDYFDDTGPRLIKSETITDTGFPQEKLLTAYKGYPVVDTKTYTRNYYTQESIVAPKDATLISGLSPIEIDANKKYDVIGQVTIDDILYAVVAAGASRTVFLVDNYGKVYHNIGVIKNDRLVLLTETNYIVNPEDFRFESVSATKMVQSEMTKGFEIRFDGIKLDRVVFNLMEYHNGEAGSFSNFNFPRRPGVVDIRGLKIKIFEANDSKIEYMIVK